MSNEGKEAQQQCSFIELLKHNKLLSITMLTKLCLQAKVAFLMYKLWLVSAKFCLAWSF